LVEENRQSPDTGTKNSRSQSSVTHAGPGEDCAGTVQTFLARMRGTGVGQHPKQGGQRELAVPAAYRSEHPQKATRQNRQVLAPDGTEQRKP